MEPEPETKLRNFFGLGSSQKGRLRLRLRLRNTGYQLIWRKVLVRKKIILPINRKYVRKLKSVYYINKQKTYLSANKQKSFKYV